MKLKAARKPAGTVRHRLLAAAICATATTLPFVSQAGSSFTITNTTADAFLATGSEGNPSGTDLTSVNYGTAGTLAIAPPSSANGEFDSLIKFNLAGAAAAFNAAYGPGNWQISGLTLQLASNVGTQGAQPRLGLFNPINAGSFGIDWLANDDWVEGAGTGTGAPGFPAESSVSYNAISLLFGNSSAGLGTFTYTPPGDSVYANYTLPLEANLLADAAAGGDVSLYFFATDDQVSYLFNSREFPSNHPELTVDVVPIPEPGTGALMGTGLAGLVWWHRRKFGIGLRLCKKCFF